MSEQLGAIAKPRNEVGAGTGVSNIRFAPDLAGKGYSSEGESLFLLRHDWASVDSVIELFFHTDRSGWDQPPGLLLTSLQVKSETGGESLLVDSQEVIEAIRIRHPKLLGLITDSKYSSFRNDDGIFVPRPIYDEATGILRFRFDDGIQLSASLVDAFPTLRALIYEFARPICLETGQCYIIDNHRFLHGRTSFTGERELLRTLVYPHVPAPQIKSILFDIDGTLCRSEALSIDAFYRCISDVVAKSITHENTKVNLHGQTDLSLVQDILRYHGFEERNVQSATRRFLSLHPQYLEESLAKGFRSERCPEADKLLRWLACEKQARQTGRHSPGEPIVCIGLLTGNSQRNAYLKLRAAGIDPGLFEFGISAFGDKSGNREGLVRDSIGKLESRYGRKVERKNVILVGDTPLDIACAKSTGCGIVAVATGNYSKCQLASLGPDLICERLPEARPHLSAILSQG